MLELFRDHLSPKQFQSISRLKSPADIQGWLNETPYSPDEWYRCPISVIRDRKAHCFDGALFAAAILRGIGYSPLIIELIPNDRDDDHLLAVFKKHGYWGAVAQSNFSGLRYREPIYRTIRELTLSYFEDFFNAKGEKTLRGYRGPFNLATFDYLKWMTKDTGLEKLAEAIDRYRIIHLLTPGMIADLAPVDERSLKAGLLGSNPEGLFKND